ncbi:EAL domain-containing protein [Aurantiacibacter marinus]|uniref:Diguanylate cyclase n=1 Tax=Aurantiacibacter marinus TaxID=874156 RepID=A0A0H0XLU4_9SPHN|nr:EAL domain-containing protein [Aurantiacibacter marinus]KLI63573.1 hypothetical protein AAV99_07355 [Aurantiacibacter marinus]
MAWLGDHFHTQWRLAVAGFAISPAFIVMLCMGGMSRIGLILACAAIVAGNIGLGRALGRNTAERLASAKAHLDDAEVILKKAQTDPVTGLFNRSGGDACLPLLAEDLAADEHLILMSIDLRRFRETNNLLGYAVGDEVLRKVSLRLQEAAPPGALIARISGDRFLLACRHAAPESATGIASLINQAMAVPLHIDGHRIPNGAAIGVATMPGDAQCIEQLQNAADLALYHARAAMHGEMRFHHPGMIRSLDHQKRTESELRDAILKNDISVTFQPVADLRTGKICAFEAQAIWLDPVRGEMALDQILTSGEAGGQVITLGNWLTTQAATAAKDWPSDVSLSVKLLPSHIMASGAALGVLAALNATGLDPVRLEIQIGGNMLRGDDTAVREFVDHLDKHGVCFAIDDPEISHASIQQILRYPFCSMRIRSEPRGDVAVRAMASLGQPLGLTLLASDLACAAQLRTARSAGCTMGQGRYISQEVSAEIALQLLKREKDPSVEDLFGARQLAS